MLIGLSIKDDMQMDNKQIADNSHAEHDLSEQTLKTLLGKYAGIIISIFLFLVITLSILAYNYFMSGVIAYQTSTANLAARQGVLVQTLAKEIMNIELLQQQNINKHQATSDEVRLVAKKLELSVETFDNTLNAFAEGGDIINDSGELIQLQRITDKEGRKSIENAQELWRPYKRLIDSFLLSIEEGDINIDTIHFASDYARIFNASLFREVNDLEQSIVTSSNQSSQLIKNVQLIGFALIALLFIYVVFGALRQLFNADTQLSKAREQTAEILATVKEGLFLIDRDLIIADEYSQALEGIINQQDIAGKKLTDVLSDLVCKKDLEDATIFIEQLYSDWVIEELINDLNPLSKLRVQIKTEDNTTVERYLDFKFSRVYHGDEIVRILVNVFDITESVLLEQTLEKEQAKNDQQLEMLNSIINSDATLLQGFIYSTSQRIAKVNNILKESGNSLKKLTEKAQEINREIHSLKGEASALQLTSFVNLTEKIETEIKELLETNDLEGHDFLSLTMHLNELLNLTIFVDNLSNRIGYVSTQTENMVDTSSASTLKEVLELKTTATKPHSNNINMCRYYSKFATDIAERHHKEVAFQCIGINSIQLSQEQNNLVKDISIQLLRNAIVHGIELPEIREKKHKNRAGNITLKLTKKDDILTLTLTDDGQGINYDKIRQTALDSGKYDPELVNQWSDKKLLQLLFTSGFSTAKNQGEDAGRGVGMDIIKTLVKQLHGKLKVGSKADIYSRFTITFPNKS